MKIKIIQPIAGNAEPMYRLAEFAFPPGAIVDVDDVLARNWIKADIAIAAKKTDELSFPAEVYTLKPKPQPAAEPAETEAN